MASVTGQRSPSKRFYFPSLRGRVAFLVAATVDQSWLERKAGARQLFPSVADFFAFFLGFWRFFFPFFSTLTAPNYSDSRVSTDSGSDLDACTVRGPVRYQVTYHHHFFLLNKNPEIVLKRVFFDLIYRAENNDIWRRVRWRRWQCRSGVQCLIKCIFFA